MKLITLINEIVDEAVKSNHLKTDSYPTRILQGGFSKLPIKHKHIVDERFKFLEDLEFDIQNDARLGVWLYSLDEEIKHPPYQLRDKGKHLLVIISNNTLITIYWKHKKEGKFDYGIEYGDLVKFSESEYYDFKNKPVTIKNLDKFLNPDKYKTKLNPNKFKKIALSDGTIIKYYFNVDKFKTLDDKELNIDDIFDSLPEDIQELMLDKV